MDTSILTAIITGGAAVVASGVGGYFAGRRGGGHESSSASDRPPLVVATNPPDLAAEVLPDIRPTATFSKDMDGATINPNTFKLLDQSTGDQVRPAVRNGVVYDESTKVATFLPAAALENGIRYGATITSGVKDKVGNALAQDETWHFTVAARQEAAEREAAEREAAEREAAE
jgi:hypothetical protein